MFYPGRINRYALRIICLALVAVLGWAILSGLKASAAGRKGARASVGSSSVKHKLQDAPLVDPNAYHQTNLVSDLPGVAQIQDPLLVNPWGITQSATSPFWVANNKTSTSTLYGGDVSGSPFTKNPLNVTIPGDEPTGVVFNGGSDFAFTGGGSTGPARFIFASITGNIVAWKGGLTTAVIVAHQNGHVYTGLAIGNNGVANFLYAADFANKKIDVYDKNFASATLSGNFTDPTLPSDYSPFNIQSLGGKLYVQYAKVDPMTGEEEKGPGNGYVSTFDFNGTFLGRLISNGPLNAPWGVAIAPATNFGPFVGALLVGNFGDGRINAFNATTGAFLGTLNDQAGNPIEIEDLWAITFGNGAGGGETSQLYFAAGIDDENHGLFGKLQAAAPAPVIVQFSSATYTASESAGSVDITVTRTGDPGNALTVNYATFDGSASQQTADYIIATGTLTMAAGQLSKTFKILLPDDVYVEGDETVNLILSNPTSAALGVPNRATLTITDNDTAGATTPSPKLFSAALSGSQEVPPTGSTARGTALILLSADETTAKVSVNFSGLSSAETGKHIHGPAAPGSNAPIIFPLPAGQVNNFDIALSPAQVQQLKDGSLYTNVHSTNFPNGEIRGQFLFNPIDESRYFVREQYLDFLNREPDAGGLAYWANQLDACGVNSACRNTRRVDISAAFFIEAEFQQTGFFVYRVRRASLGTQPTYGQYVIDRNQLGSGSDTSRTAFAQSFAQRPEFLAKYPATQNGSDFIDALIANIQASSGVNLTPRRPELVNEYILGVTQAESRARVIRKAIEYPEYIAAETNPAFVLSEYFGYLRRDPDAGGYQFWLNVLNATGNFRSMVCAFINSAEYQLRFGPNVTHDDRECSDAPAGPAPPNIYGVTTNNKLVSVNSNAPGTILASTAITGLTGGENVIAIDFRPANGKLYALTSGSRLYTINTSTAAATLVGSFASTISGSTIDVGFDFNPTVDRIRLIVGNTQQNLRLNPDTGAIAGTDTNVAFAAGDPNVSRNPPVVHAAAYSNNFTGTTTTTLYDIIPSAASEVNKNVLATQGSPGGSPTSPNTGQLFTVANINVPGGGAIDNIGFDIGQNGVAYLAAHGQDATQNTLFILNLSTGAMTSLGLFGGADNVRDIAVAL